MTDGQRYESSVEEYAALLNLPLKDENFTDVYRTNHQNHDSMKNMYKAIPAKEQQKWKLGSMYFLLPGLATINSILQVTLMPKSGDDRMIRGYSIDMVHLVDKMEMLNVMDLIVDSEEDICRSQELMWLCFLHLASYQLQGW